MAPPTMVPTRPSLPLDHPGPWTEAEFMALPEDCRVELLDGTLLVIPRGKAKHQFLAAAVWQEFRVAHRPGWRAVQEFTVRVGADRIFVPDVCVFRTSVVPDDVIADATDVGLVVEVASPSTVMLDRHVKTRAYAEAGIPRLLRVEFSEDGPVGLLSALDEEGGGYRLAQRAEPGEVLRVDHPFPVDLDLAALLAEC